MTMTDLSWLDRTEYPFASHFYKTPHGQLHYVDEGSGDTILMVHGLGAWSFIYRHLIKALSQSYRVIVPDHLGFGLSDRPTDFDYRPASQAEVLKQFIQAHNLTDFTMIVHDFGGPIGLSYAVGHPNHLRRLVLFNTWLWALQDDMSKVIAGTVLGSAFGRLLYQRLNIEVNLIMPSAYGDRSTLTPAVHAHYRHPFEQPTTRYAAWRLSRELLHSKDWYAALWSQRDVLHNIPALLLWGERDPVFGRSYLARWQALFQQATVVTYPKTGHFVQEEQGAAVVPPIQEFLGAT